MPRYMLAHRHRREECAAAFAAWNGFDSPLRHQAANASCARSLDGEHRLWWEVDAPAADAALALLPPFVADRTEVTEIQRTPIP